MFQPLYRLGNTYKSYKRKDIVMKGADKGGEVSVSRSEIYQQQAFQQLSDTIFFMPALIKISL